MTLEGEIRRLSKEVAESDQSIPARQAAERTGGVPVYSDIGGTLVVAPNGDVLHFDPDTESVRPVTEDRWRNLALARAAKRFPELVVLAPLRPPDATTCPACGGLGVVLGSVGCAECTGLGWV
jgi:hypothetical protein